jgi:hypothetical protein
MKRIQHLAFLLAAAGLPMAGAAQFDDPQQKIRDLTERIAKDLQEIDELLLQTGAKGIAQAADSMARSAAKLDELLEQAETSQGSAVQGIDELIQQLEQMRGNCSGCSQCDGGKPHDKPSEQNQPKPSGQRQESETPDMMQRGGNQPRREVPRPQPEPEAGSNQPADRERAHATEQVEHQTESGKWGMLPDYMELLKTRGAQPDVPERYRRFRDAFLKQGQPTEDSPR